ncbi:hypothetical protein JHK82_033908 [Glycine max]|nr:hypothetical protein JHK85_034619 [Glycine max]KAG4986298.1 hypothetical protein JHK86_033989 [Glycine max]KAG5119488.1 hypothetical protein JHK82_033908 [Glycine max]KAG5140479.1 hypothetical protein JHK84_034247 [Glycine max]
MPYTDYMKPDTETYNWVIQAYTRVESYASLCVIGLTPSHIAFKDEGGITAVDFNVGKSDCSGIKVIGKRKKGKSAVKPRTSLVSPSRMRTPGPSLVPKEVRLTQQGSLAQRSWEGLLV